jgi:hypothetical protein
MDEIGSDEMQVSNEFVSIDAKGGGEIRNYEISAYT